MLRAKGVVEKFVEFYGPRPVANVASRSRHRRQHGARVRSHDGLFPRRRRNASLLADGPLARTRRRSLIESRPIRRSRVLFRTDDTPDPEFTDTLELDLSAPSSQASLDRNDRKTVFALSDDERQRSARRSPTSPQGQRASVCPSEELSHTATVSVQRHPSESWGMGPSSSRRSRPAPTPRTRRSCWVRAFSRRKRLSAVSKFRHYVKTSLAPGSKVVTEYLQEAGLLALARRFGVPPRGLRLHHVYR